jgi:hypothetical protein
MWESSLDIQGAGNEWGQLLQEVYKAAVFADFICGFFA